MTERQQQLSLAVSLIILNFVIIAFATSEYDSIECDPHSNRARAGRARLVESIPCDFSKQNYCNLPGESYPWNAVKKFVYDNQGLVRRMYGDLRHIYVMQSENENEIDIGEYSADKYSKAFNMHHSQRQAKDATAQMPKNEERKNYRNGDSSEPHFRPVVQRPTNNKQRKKPPKDFDKNSLIDNQINSNGNVDDTRAKLTSETSEKTTKLASNTPSSTTSYGTASSSEAINTEMPTIESDQKDNEAVDKAVFNLFSNISSAFTAKTIRTTLETSTMSKVVSENTQEPSITERSSNPQNIENEGEIFSMDSIDTQNDTVASSISESTSTTTEAQLFQDSMIIPIPLNKRGVNACPVKEEVVAPFWGNNTRGEVLALLNVYPFEQYINWEKCTHENEQMYCRKGCRCEQQYRLHRLLAYNPLDACRGIFSDWFRFPSCCICKCYDIPLDYRVTSRSPRGTKQSQDGIMEKDENDDQETYFDDEGS